MIRLGARSEITEIQARQNSFSKTELMVIVYLMTLGGMTMEADEEDEDESLALIKEWRRRNERCSILPFAALCWKTF